MPRPELLQSIATRIGDYRAGDRIAPRTPELVDQWVQQFPAEIQVPLLEGLDYVFERTYISRERLRAFLQNVSRTNLSNQAAPARDYWQQANVLDIQLGGQSQKAICRVFDEVLQEAHGLRLADIGSNIGEFVYLDDCIATGSRVRTDLCAWLEREQNLPNHINLHLISPIRYAGSYWIDEKIRQTATAQHKTIQFRKWSPDGREYENTRARRSISDVLWPATIPADPDVQAYFAGLQTRGYPPVMRPSGGNSAAAIFRDENQRNLLEQAFLIRGSQLRRECPNLPERERPLGHHNLDCLGFGNMFVTFRNCPNNSPLALWVQQEAYPALLPRKTNAQTANQHVLRTVLGDLEL